MVPGSGTVALWSVLGKIGREGKVEMHGTFPSALVPIKAGPVPLKRRTSEILRRLWGNLWFIFQTV